MVSTPIVVVAYNRPRSLSRLLRSISEARYSSEAIDLIISIDRAENNQDVLKIAEDFEWRFGFKKVVYQEKNLGLRKHILKCGDLSLEYGSVIVLEDDLFVSPNFYLFTEQALKFSESEPKIGGISLYNHQLNVHTRQNFKALEDGFDNWYFQFASSWGQAWTKNQWKGFMDWYSANPNIDDIDEVPRYVRSWSPKSWLKYNIAYLIAENRFFLYPKIAVATNFSDAGTHVGNDSTIYQVPLDYATNKKYRFSSPSEAKAIYDAFYESEALYESLGMEKHEVCIDLFGYKPDSNTRYLLTSKLLNHKIVRSYGKSLKPHEDNIVRQIEGNDLFLYDTSINVQNPNEHHWTRDVSYNYKQIPFRTARKLFVEQAFVKMNNLKRRIFKTRR